jgi:hypothetical protein
VREFAFSLSRSPPSWPFPRARSPTPRRRQCVDANTKAEPFRRDGKFAETLEQLTVCIDARCPKKGTRRLHEAARPAGSRATHDRL